MRCDSEPCRYRRISRAAVSLLIGLFLGSGSLDADESKYTEDYSIPLTVSGSVLAKNGQPVAGARVFLASHTFDIERLAETKTDGKGRYELRDVDVPIEGVNKENTSEGGSFQVYALGKGQRFAWRSTKYLLPRNGDTLVEKAGRARRAYYAGDRAELDLRLAPLARFTGRVVDDAGVPVEGARVSLRSCRFEALDEFGNHEGFGIEDPGEFTSIEQGQAVPESARVRKTDAAGQFEFTNLPRGCRLGGSVSAKGLSRRRITITTLTSKRLEALGLDEDAKRLRSGCEVVLARPRRVPLRVVLDDTDAPADKVFVNAHSKSGSSWKTSDADGRAVLELAPGDYTLTVVPKHGTPYLRYYGDLEVGEKSPAEAETVRMRRGADIEVRVVDVAGRPVSGVGLWVWHPVEGEAENLQKISRMEYVFRSWEVAKNFSHANRPQTDKEGKLRTHVRPGACRIGINSFGYPGSFDVLEGGTAKSPNLALGHKVDAKAGEVTKLEFRVQL